MKNIPYVLSGVLAIAVVILFVLVLGLKKDHQVIEDQTKLEAGDTLTAKLPIAYVNIDSLLTNYDFAITASDKLMSKFKTSNNSVSQKQKQFEKEVTEFQRKIQQNAFLSEERAQQESQRLQKLESDLQQMAQRLQNELAREEQKMNEDIADSVRLCLDSYNKTAKYHMIFANKGLDNILVAETKYDITTEVLTILNNRYKASVNK